MSSAHVAHIVCSIYMHSSGLNIFVALSLVYNAWTGDVITLFVASDFRVYNSVAILTICATCNNNNNNNK